MRLNMGPPGLKSDKVQAPPQKYLRLARATRVFSRSSIYYLLLHTLPMPPRTPLTLIDGNRRFKEELTPNNRGKIEGAIAAGAIYAFAAENVNCAPSTARYTVQ